MTTYTVIHAETRERGTFTSAHDAAAFLWGRVVVDYRVFKNGALVKLLEGDDLAALEKALEAA